MKKYLLFVLVWMPLIAFSQVRYQDELFEKVNRTTEVYMQKNGQDYALDIYQPEGDTVKNRPMIIMVHGGGFSGGVRDEPRYINFLETFARLGYVGVSISYELRAKDIKGGVGCEMSRHEKVEIFKHTVHDLRKATAYLLDKSSEVGFDASQIILAGSSAGAECILHAAYWPSDYMNIGEQILPDDFRYAGAVSLAGAILSLDWITKENAIPTMLFHGTCDNLVPYADAPHHYCEIDKPGYMVLHGGYSIAMKLQSVGESYFLYTDCGGHHGLCCEPLSENIPDMIDYLYETVIQKRTIQQHIIVKNKIEDRCAAYGTYDFCE
ncbi:alpha/beta hydrolase [Limibacter armeniacum]|uniref:alpha/beta hydrolase n=1 Tax=Limibacter armeniacum TaxID=466084 RepID=UPI002FE651B8